MVRNGKNQYSNAANARASSTQRQTRGSSQRYEPYADRVTRGITSSRGRGNRGRRGGGGGGGSQTRRTRVGNYVPDIEHYTQVHTLNRDVNGRLTSASRCNPQTQSDEVADQFEFHQHKAKDYIERFKVPMTMEELDEKAGNMSEYDNLAAIVEEMQDKDFPVQATSGIWELEGTGESVMVYLSHRYDSHEKVTEPLSLDMQKAPHRLKEAVEQARKEGKKMHFDGFPDAVIKRWEETVHTAVAYNIPQADLSQLRHGVEGVSGTATHKFPISNRTNHTDNPLEAKVRPGVDKQKKGFVFSEDGKTGVEGVGINHYVDAWPMRAHSSEYLHQSSAMSGSGQAIRSTDNFFRSNVCLERCVEGALKIHQPEQHKLFKKAREAARVVGDEGSGCYGGRAVVFKMQLYLHCDQGDEGMSISFPAGRFTGGYLIIPQFRAKLWYRPGDLVLLYANKIWHTIDFWKATKMNKHHNTTPGRVGTVFFFPTRSLEGLLDKEAGWAADTMHGRLPTCRPERHS
ncbi:hypothetical protein AAF712_006937 [Marasmius tenuissimus]|uniref:Uncharacterized protein n=1 Tax=Marasmius tenuissimus TaxID=585030 RepID=A0ABR2ZWP7_9AGAR